MLSLLGGLGVLAATGFALRALRAPEGAGADRSEWFDVSLALILTVSFVAGLALVVAAFV